LAQTITQKIAAMLSDFVRRTGKVIGIVEVMTQTTPANDHQVNITQTVNLKYGDIVNKSPIIGG
jgi:hypothetical protein